MVEEHDVCVREHFDRVLNNKLAGITLKLQITESLLLYISFYASVSQDWTEV